MPQIKADHIVSFSSEDSKHPASNLLSTNTTGGKWIGKDMGALSNSLVLQLEKSCKITSIQIGNHHSAFVEVLAGRSECPDKFEALLNVSSFMNPADSRRSLKISSVRSFTYEKLCSPAKEKKWDRIRIVCSQPFNKYVKYGLSFIHFFSSDSYLKDPDHTPPVDKSQLLGKFRLRNDSEEDNESSFKPGELFARSKKQSSLSADAQIRIASSPHNMKDSQNLLVKTQRPIIQNKLPVNDKTKTSEMSFVSKKRNEVMYIDEDDEPNEKIDNLIKKDKEEKLKNNEVKKPDNKINSSKVQNNKNLGKTSHSTDKTPLSQDENSMRPKNETHNNNTSIASTSHDSNVSNELKRKISPDKDLLDKKPRLTHSRYNPKLVEAIRGPNCFGDVIFVISGYENPRRGRIRDMAISLGAKYNTDWGGNCTHLICAFANTPKHEKLKKTKNGVVVTAEWIEECYKEQERLPWRWFATDPQQRVDRPPAEQSADSSNSNLNYGASTSDKIPDPVSVNSDDTDDEIEKIMQMQKKTESLDEIKKKSALLAENDGESIEVEEKKKTDVNPKHDDDTDKTDIEDNIHNNNNYENYRDEDFSGIKFFVDTNLLSEQYDCDLIKRYIIAFNGELVESWPDPKIDVAITSDILADYLRPGKEKKCQLIRPEWIWKCNDKNGLYPFEKYAIKKH